MVEVLDENLALPDIPPLHYSLPWPPSLLCQPRPHQLTLPVEAEEEAEAGASGLTSAAGAHTTLELLPWPEAKACLLLPAPPPNLRLTLKYTE